MLGRWYNSTLKLIFQNANFLCADLKEAFNGKPSLTGNHTSCIGVIGMLHRFGHRFVVQIGWCQIGARNILLKNQLPSWIWIPVIKSGAKIHDFLTVVVHALVIFILFDIH